MAYGMPLAGATHQRHGPAHRRVHHRRRCSRSAVFVAVLALTKDQRVHRRADRRVPDAARHAASAASAAVRLAGLHVEGRPGSRVGYLIAIGVSFANNVVLQGIDRREHRQVDPRPAGRRTRRAQTCGIGRAFVRWLLLIVDRQHLLPRRPDHRVGHAPAPARRRHGGGHLRGRRSPSVGRPIAGRRAARTSTAYGQPGAAGWAPPGAAPPPAAGWGAAAAARVGRAAARPQPGWGAPPPPRAARAGARRRRRRPAGVRRRRRPRPRRPRGVRRRRRRPHRPARAGLGRTASGRRHAAAAPPAGAAGLGPPPRAGAARRPRPRRRAPTAPPPRRRRRRRRRRPNRRAAAAPAPPPPDGRRRRPRDTRAATNRRRAAEGESWWNKAFGDDDDDPAVTARGPARAASAVRCRE